MSNIPKIGFGTYKIGKGEDAYKVVCNAIKIGYRHFDTAKLYGNEKDVGRAIRDAMCEYKLNRSEFHVTTKIQFSDMFKHKIENAVERSLRFLDISYIDLILLHGPMGDKTIRNWKDLEKVKMEKGDKIRNIGVSNFKVNDLENILRISKIKPHVNQIEITPFLQRRNLVKFCKDNNIPIVSHSTLTKGYKLNNPLLVDIAKKYNVSSAQVLLKWARFNGYIVIPRSVNALHMQENINLDFDVEECDVQEMNKLEEKFATHPRYI